MKRILVAVLFALTACASLPKTRADVVFPTPPQYAAWYAEVEQCSGVKGDFHTLNVFASDQIYFRGEDLNGLWSPIDNMIVLRRDRVLSEESFKHEVLHSLLKTTAHPRKYFSQVCGNLSSGATLSD